MSSEGGSVDNVSALVDLVGEVACGRGHHDSTVLPFSLEKIAIDGRLDRKILATVSQEIKKAPASNDTLCHSSILPARVKRVLVLFHENHVVLFRERRGGGLKSDISEESHLLRCHGGGILDTQRPGECALPKADRGGEGKLYSLGAAPRNFK